MQFASSFLMQAVTCIDTVAVPPCSDPYAAPIAFIGGHRRPRTQALVRELEPLGLTGMRTPSGIRVCATPS